MDIDIKSDDIKYKKPKEEIKRINDIDNILKYFNEKDIPDSIIHKINNLYPITKKCKFIRTEELEVGILIVTISLDLKKISGISVIAKIDMNSSQKYGSLLLVNSLKDIYWRIKPDNYYIFKIDRSILKTMKFREMLLEIKEREEKKEKEEKEEKNKRKK
jgi:hypothetical protein